MNMALGILDSMRECYIEYKMGDLDKAIFTMPKSTYTKKQVNPLIFNMR